MLVAAISMAMPGVAVSILEIPRRRKLPAKGRAWHNNGEFSHHRRPGRIFRPAASHARENIAGRESSKIRAETRSRY